MMDIPIVRNVLGVLVLLAMAAGGFLVPMVLLGVLRRVWWTQIGAVAQSQSSWKWLMAGRYAVAGEFVTRGDPGNAVRWLFTGSAKTGRTTGNRGVAQQAREVDQAQQEGVQLVAIGANGRKIATPGGPSDYLRWLELVSSGQFAPNAPSCASLARTLYELEVKQFDRELRGKKARNKPRRRGVRSKLAECLSGQNVANPWLDALEQWGRATAEIAITARAGKSGGSGDASGGADAAASAGNR